MARPDPLAELVAALQRLPGIGARSAVGMMSLPGNIPVEVEAVFAIAAG